MDLKFDWQTYRFETKSLRAYRGKVMMHARVRMPGFAIHCRVEPNDDGHSYNWVFFPGVWTGSGMCFMPEHQEGRSGQFNEPIEAMADVERILRLEVAACFAGRRSIIDRWWPAIVSALRR